jgi:hypothetical protein
MPIRCFPEPFEVVAAVEYRIYTVVAYDEAEARQTVLNEYESLEYEVVEREPEIVEVIPQ